MEAQATCRAIKNVRMYLDRSEGTLPDEYIADVLQECNGNVYDTVGYIRKILRGPEFPTEKRHEFQP